MRRLIRRVLALTLALFGLANAVRVVLALQALEQIPAGVTAIPPVYIAAMSAVWAVVFAWVAYGVARSRQWSARGTIATIVLYQANLWLNHFAFSRSTEATQREGFAALLSVLSIVWIGGMALIAKRFMTHKS